MNKDWTEDPGALPREWLPEASPPEESAEWDRRVQRIMAAADLPTPSSVWTTIGSWWKPAAVLTAAAAALLWMVRAPAPAPASVPLSLVAIQADAQTLLNAVAPDADPVLALIALRATAEPAATHTPSEGP